MTALAFSFDAEADALMKDWEQRVQETFIAKAEPRLSDPNVPATIDAGPAPRPNIVVSRTPSDSTVEQACEDFLKSIKPVVPQLEILAQREEFVFRDGVAGVFVQMRFPPMPGVYLYQTHAFRLDDGVLTQLVSTCSEQQVSVWRDRMHAAMAGFRPEAATARPA